MIEHESPVAAKEEGLVGTDTVRLIKDEDAHGEGTDSWACLQPKYDYGEGMKSTRDFTGKQSLVGKSPCMIHLGEKLTSNRSHNCSL